jgi:hypothetical protein
MSDETKPSGPTGERTPRMPRVQQQEVSLGCGTLILIALIVLIFGRGGTDDMERELKGLRAEVNELKAAVQHQTVQMKALQAEMTKARE